MIISDIDQTDGRKFESGGGYLLDWVYASDVKIRGVKMRNSGFCTINGEDVKYPANIVVRWKDDPINELIILFETLRRSSPI